jgi:AcrR family transcriptional regulator
MPSAPNKRPSKTRKPQARGLARRKAILDAAVRLFGERGFRATGITGLAKEVGISHVGLLHYFGTKENLLHAVVARRDAERAERFEHLASLRGLEALRAITLIGEDNAEDHVHTRLLIVLVGENLQPDDPLNGYFRDRYEVMRTLIAGAVRSGQEDGEIRAEADAETVATEVTAFIAGASLGWLLDPDAIDIGATYRDYVTRLIADLAGPATRR